MSFTNIKILAAGIGMGASLYFIKEWLNLSVWNTSGINLPKFLWLGFFVTLGMTIYFTLAYLFRVPHLKEFIQKIKNKIIK